MIKDNTIELIIDGKKEYEDGETFTITLGDKAENHKGMQMIGEDNKDLEGFTLNDFKNFKTIFEKYFFEINLSFL